MNNCQLSQLNLFGLKCNRTVKNIKLNCMRHIMWSSLGILTGILCYTENEYTNIDEKN